MAQIDQQAAQEELDKAAHLKEKAEELIGIAADLQEEAQSHEQEARELMAPAKMAPRS